MAHMEHVLEVRNYDTDRNGTVPCHRLARMFEYTRWLAGPHPVLYFDRFFQDGNRIVVRAQKLQLGEAVQVGDSVRIVTTIGHIGTTSITICHDAFVDGSQARRVGQSEVIGVHLDPSGRPKRVPDAFRELERPDEWTPIGLTPPAAGREPEGALESPIVVKNSDLDFLQHVNQANYLRYFDDVRADIAASRHARAVAIEHTGEAKDGDMLTVRSWWDEGDLCFDLRRAKKVICRATFGLSPISS